LYNSSPKGLANITKTVDLVQGGKIKQILKALADLDTNFYPNIN